jgi:hypothetical protein
MLLDLAAGYLRDHTLAKTEILLKRALFLGELAFPVPLLLRAYAYAQELGAGR